MINFSMLPEDSSVTFGDIDKFEEVNDGLLEIYVYQWSTIPWASEDFQYLTPARSPSNEGAAKVTVLLLLHDSHFVLIYDLDQLSSARSIRLPDSQRAGGRHSWNRCHRCVANFSRLDLARQVCSLEPGKRITPALQMPDSSKEEDRLHYKAGPSAALHPCVVYADFEVFNCPAPLPDPRILAKQHRVASFAYMVVGDSQQASDGVGTGH